GILSGTVDQGPKDLARRAVRNECLFDASVASTGYISELHKEIVSRRSAIELKHISFVSRVVLDPVRAVAFNATVIEAVSASATVQAVETKATVDEVIAFTTKDHVAPFVAGQAVVAFATDQRVNAQTTEQFVIVIV
ncbi:hypothetical protein CGU37_28890, partial [Pseudomonas fluorescens]